MKLLLDSHLLLWWPLGSPRLGRQARELILDGNSQLFMSAASWWELGLKCALGKLQADLTSLRGVLSGFGVVSLPVTVEHGEMASLLPIVHRDPFDHMLVAQAQAEGLRLLNPGQAFGALWHQRPVRLDGRCPQSLAASTGPARSGGILLDAWAK